MRAKVIAVGLALGAIAALVLPGGALADAGQSRRAPAAVDAFLTLPGSRGFGFTLFVLPDRVAALTASKFVFGTGVETVSYSNAAGGKSIGGLHGRELNVRFGRLGHFRGHFVTKSTKTQKPEPGCTGGPTIDEDGFFVGSFDFHGERGFTDAHATRAQGSINHSGAQRCAETSRPRHPGREKARRAHEARGREGEFRLLAGSESGRFNVQVDRLQGHGAKDPASVTISASSEETVGALQIGRSASIDIFGPTASSILQTPNSAEPLAEATLQPPAPFSGSATFTSDDPASASWTGDLAVSLPGAAPLPLTGNGIAVGACQGASDCTKTLPERLQSNLELTNGGGFFFGGATAYAPKANKSSRPSS
jgi:hypothetical protein